MELSHDSNLNAIELYDLQLIHKMCRGDEEKIAKMVKVFIDQTSQTIKEILASYSEKDFSTIKKLAHKIKPTLTYFGTSSLEKELIYLEDLLQNDFNLSELELESKIQHIESLIKLVVAKMKNDFNIIN